jgi:hypothetical protein
MYESNGKGDVGVSMVYGFPTIARPGGLRMGHPSGRVEGGGEATAKADPCGMTNKRTSNGNGAMYG